MCLWMLEIVSLDSGASLFVYEYSTHRRKLYGPHFFFTRTTILQQYVDVLSV